MGSSQYYLDHKTHYPDTWSLPGLSTALFQCCSANSSTLSENSCLNLGDPQTVPLSHRDSTLSNQTPRVLASE